MISQNFYLSTNLCIGCRPLLILALTNIITIILDQDLRMYWQK